MTDVAVIGPPLMGIETVVVAIRRSVHELSSIP